MRELIELGPLAAGFVVLLLLHVSVGFGLISTKQREILAASVAFFIAFSALIAAAIYGFDRFGTGIIIVSIVAGILGVLRYRGVRIGPSWW